MKYGSAIRQENYINMGCVHCGKRKRDKKITETFRIPVDKRLTPIERRNIEEQIKILIKNGKV